MRTCKIARRPHQRTMGTHMQYVVRTHLRCRIAQISISMWVYAVNEKQKWMSRVKNHRQRLIFHFQQTFCWRFCRIIPLPFAHKSQTQRLHVSEKNRRTAKSGSHHRINTEQTATATHNNYRAVCVSRIGLIVQEKQLLQLKWFTVSFSQAATAI